MFRIVFLTLALAAPYLFRAQEALNAFEDCNCPEGTVGRRCQHESMLDSIFSLEAAILGYDSAYVQQDFAFRELVDNKVLGRYN